MGPLAQLEEGYCRTSYGYIFYRRLPSPGPKIIMLHGLGADSRTWKKLIRYLPGGFDVYMPDLLGHGRSDAPDIDYQIGVQVRVLGDFIASAGIETPVLFGNSYGAWIAGLYAVADGTDCRGIVFEDSAGLEPFMEHLRDTGEEGRYRSWLLEGSLKICPNRPHVMSSIINNSGVHTITAGTLARIRCPSLVIWGSNDTVLPSSLANWMCSEIPECKLSIIDGADHIPHISKPDVVGQLLSDFVSGLR